MAGDTAGVSESFAPQQARLLRIGAGAFAILVAWLHILHPEYGYGRLLRYLESGTLYDPRPPLFVLSGLAIFAGIVLVFKGVAKRPAYLVGIGLISTYLLGYVAWHTILDHGAFWPHTESHHHKNVGVVESMIAHLQADTIAIVSKGAELVLLILLTVLYVVDTE